MATRHCRASIPSSSSGPKLLVAADAEQSRVDYATDVLGYAGGTTDYTDVLADDRVDVVSICSPNFLHAEMAVAAAQAGKHFWIEKPVGRGVGETAAVAAAADDGGVITSVGFNYRHAPMVEHLKTMIADGRLGRITNVRARFFAGYSADPRAPLSWRFTRRLAGSGVLGDLGSHAADLCTYLVGPMTELTALTGTVHRERPIPTVSTVGHGAAIERGELGAVENEDYAGALVRFADGAVGTLEASRVAVGPDCAYGIEIYGTAGSAMWDFERMNELRISVGQGTADAGYVTVNANVQHGDFARFQPGAGMAMSFDDLKIIEAKKFLVAVAGGPQENSTIADALAAAAFVMPPSAPPSPAAGSPWRLSCASIDGSGRDSQVRMMAAPFPRAPHPLQKVQPPSRGCERRAEAMAAPSARVAHPLQTVRPTSKGCSLKRAGGLGAVVHRFSQRHFPYGGLRGAQGRPWMR